MTMASASMMGNVLPGMWSFMLAARARGLGTAWTTVHLMMEQQAAEVLAFVEVDRAAIDFCHVPHDREAEARARGSRDAHEMLRLALAEANEADKQAREARRETDRAMAEGARALSRAEADRNLAAGKLNDQLAGSTTGPVDPGRVDAAAAAIENLQLRRKRNGKKRKNKKLLPKKKKLKKKKLRPVKKLYPKKKLR